MNAYPYSSADTPYPYSSLDTKRLPLYRIVLPVEDWACLHDLLREATSGICDTGREALEIWTGVLAAAVPLQATRRVSFEMPAPWADLLWFELTSPAAAELGRITHSIRRQVMRSNREDRARIRAEHRI